jgi:hypothetical protein
MRHAPGVTALLELTCGDDPDGWVRLGFSVSDGDLVRVGAVAVRLTGEGGGLRGWTLAGDGGPPEIEGIPTAWRAPAAGAGEAVADEAVAHPNGALALDHVVLLTDHRDRSAAALVAAGGDERRRAGPPQVPVSMAFVRLGAAIVEVAEGASAPHLWGLVAVVEDLDALAADLGDLLGPPRDAVQPGRRIATVRGEPAGVETALAFMTPRAAGSSPPS